MAHVIFALLDSQMPKFSMNFHDFWYLVQCAAMKRVSASRRKKKKYSGTHLWEEERRDMSREGDVHKNISQC